MATVAETHGMRCPQCGSDENIRVQITTWADLLPEGSDSDGDHEWDDESPAICGGCDFEGTAYDFAINKTGDCEIDDTGFCKTHQRVHLRERVEEMGGGHVCDDDCRSFGCKARRS